MTGAKLYVPIDEKYLVIPNAKPDAKPDAKPLNNSLDDIFGMKRNTLERKIDLLEEQIEERKKNLDVNLYKIDLDLCQCGTIYLQLPYNDVEGRNGIILRHKLPLFREKRKERTEFLRDTAQLQREIIDTKLQYLSLKDKEALLE